MKKNILFAFVVSLYSISVFAQNYQCVYAEREAMFQFGFNNINGFKIDSVKTTDEGTIFYPNKNIQDFGDFECMSPYAPSWMGEKIVLKKNGDQLFFNKDKDTVLIKSLAIPGDKWIFFRNQEILIEASCTSHDTLNFLELTDSVKTISLQVFDLNMKTVESRINTYNIKLSKNYGFLEVPNIYLFPNYESYYYNTLEDVHTLCGLTNPDLGIQNLIWKDVHNYNVGDIFHTVYRSAFGTSGDDWVLEHQIHNKKIISKEEFYGLITYSIEVKIQKTINKPEWDTLIFNFDTIHLKVGENPEFDVIPGKPVIINESAYALFMESGSILKKFSLSHIQNTEEGDSCWFMPIEKTSSSINYYYNGFGGPYWEELFGNGMDYSKKELVYYHKGGQEWGIPQIVNGIENFEENNTVRIYPNPAINILNVETGDNLEKQISITRINGTVIYSQSSRENNVIINTSDFSNGVYIVSVNNMNGKLLSSQKLIIQ